jgi:acyl carrier protein
VLPEGIVPALRGRRLSRIAALKPALALGKDMVPALREQAVRWITTRKPASRSDVSRTIEEERPALVAQEGAPYALPSPVDRGAREITLHFDPARSARLTLSIDALQGELTVTVAAQTLQEVQDQSQPLSYLPHRSLYQKPVLSTLPSSPFPASTEYANEGLCVQQQGDITQRHACIFAAVLDVPVGKVKSTTNFFACGGDALALAALLQAVERQFTLTLHPEDVFAHAELSQLAELLSTRQKDISASPHGGKYSSFATRESEGYAKATT